MVRVRQAEEGASLAHTGALQASEDVAQDVFLAVWTGLPTLRNADSFGAWIRQLSRNRSHDHVRKAARHSKRVMLNEDAVAAAVEPTEPASQLARTEEERALQGALEQLQDDDREGLVLYYREGQSARQVAAP